MITIKKSPTTNAAPYSWREWNVRERMRLFFSSKLSAPSLPVRQSGYRVDNEDVALGYEAGWPSHCKKPH